MTNYCSSTKRYEPLKKEVMQDNMPGNMGLMNIHKYEEGTFSSVNSKSWTKANVDFHKRMLSLK
jgi:hypothetical protein